MGNFFATSLVAIFVLRSLEKFLLKATTKLYSLFKYKRVCVYLTNVISILDYTSLCDLYKVCSIDYSPRFGVPKNLEIPVYTIYI